MTRFSYAILITLMLLVCACQLSALVFPTPTLQKSESTTTVLRPLTTTTPTPTAVSEYKDRELCFAVSVPDGWIVDPDPSASVYFRLGPDRNQPDYKILNASDTAFPTLERALNQWKQGPLGSRIQSVENWVVDGEPALWATFESDPQIRFLVMVITPACGTGGKVELSISTSIDDREAFAAFLKRIHFLR